MKQITIPIRNVKEDIKEVTFKDNTKLTIQQALKILDYNIIKFEKEKNIVIIYN